MKGRLLLALLIAAVILSIFFTYERSFSWRNFELINSEEDLEGAVPEDEIEGEMPAEEPDGSAGTEKSSEAMAS